MGRLAFSFTVFSFLVSMWALSLWLETDRLCLPNSRISSWVVQTEGSLISTDACHTLSRLYEPRLGDNRRQILKSAIARLESTASTAQNLDLGHAVEPLSVYVNFDEPFHLQVRQRQLQIGGEWLQAKGIIEKLFFHMHLSKIKENTDPYVQEVLSDLFAAIAMNDYVFENHLLEDVYSEDPFVWNTFVLPFADYCHSDVRSPLHLEYCSFQNELAGQKGQTQSSPDLEEITIWGLRPYLSHSLWIYYSQLSLPKKSQFLRSVVAKFLGPSDKLLREPIDTSELKTWSTQFLSEWGVRSVEKSEKSFDIIIDLTNSPNVNMYELYGSVVDEWQQVGAKPSVLFLGLHGAIHFPTLRPVQWFDQEKEVSQTLYVVCSSDPTVSATNYPYEEVFVTPDCEHQQMLAKSISGLQKRDYAAQSLRRSTKGRIMIQATEEKPSL